MGRPGLGVLEVSVQDFRISAEWNVPQVWRGALEVGTARTTQWRAW